MARFEGSAKDEREDRAMAKKRGMSMKEWEASAEDREHDRKGQPSMKKHKRGIPVKAHTRSPSVGPRKPRFPTPGQNEFSPEQETAMRQGMARMNAPAARPPEDMGDEF